jgi:hypothetical protein
MMAAIPARVWLGVWLIRSPVTLGSFLMGKEAVLNTMQDSSPKCSQMIKRIQRVKAITALSFLGVFNGIFVTFTGNEKLSLTDSLFTSQPALYKFPVRSKEDTRKRTTKLFFHFLPSIHHQFRIPVLPDFAIGLVFSTLFSDRLQPFSSRCLQSFVLWRLQDLSSPKFATGGTQTNRQNSTISSNT